MTIALRAGVLSLREDDWTFQTLEGSGDMATRHRTLRLSGELVAPVVTELQAEHMRDSIVGLADHDEPEPVTFTANSELNGFYRVERSSAQLRRHGNGGADDYVQVRWELSLQRRGRGLGDAGLVSQLVGATRSNDHGVATGERWVALPAAAQGVYVGSSSPAELTRTGAGAVDVTVYRDIPAGTPARWLADPSALAAGLCRFDTDSVGVLGLTPAVNATDWQVTNQLLRLRQSATEAFRLAITDGAAGWNSELDYRVRLGATALGTPDAVQLIRNTTHTTAWRLTWTVAGTGVVTLDLSLRRGAHHVSFVARTNTAATLRVEVNDGAHTAAAGFIHDSANDGAGNRWLIGSPETNAVTTPTGWRGLEETATLLFDGYVGIELGGSAAVAGNAGTDVRDQYLEDRAELFRVVAP